MLTKKGTECKLCLKYGEGNCPVHKLSPEQLSARNRAAALAAKAKPGYSEHMSNIGKRGFAATAKKYGSDFATKKLRDYRLNNPSRPERHAMALFDSLSLTYDREVEVSGRFVDFVIRKNGTELAVPLAVEVCGYQWKACPFGREFTEDYQARLDGLKHYGLKPVVLDTRYRQDWDSLILEAIYSDPVYQ